MAGCGVDRLGEAVEALAAEDVAGCWLGDDLVAIAGLIGRLEAQWSRRLAEFDSRGDAHADGHRSTVGWLADRCRMDAGDATRAVRAARTMRDLDSVKQAWESGATTSAHVRYVSRVRHRAKADRQFDALEKVWHDLALDHDTQTLAKALAGFVDRLDNTRPDTPSAVADAIERRTLIGSECLGVGLLECRYDLESYETIMNAIDHERDRAHTEGDLRTIDQERADAFVEICRHYSNCTTDPDSHNPPVINIVNDLRTLAGLEAGLCESDRGLAWSIDTVRRLCCHAEIGRILVDEHDEILNIGRTRRLFNRAQRRALRYRDRGCCFPGCTRPARGCEPHHITPWEIGGASDLDNACLLCWTHHRLVHELKWTIRKRVNGTIDWYRKDGTFHATWHPPGRPPPINLAA